MTGPRLDGDQAVGDRVLIETRRGHAHGDREAVIVCFYNAGFGAEVRFDDGTEAYVLTSRCKVIDALGLCRVHHISRCTICAPKHRLAPPTSSMPVEPYHGIAGTGGPW